MRGKRGILREKEIRGGKGVFEGGKEFCERKKEDFEKEKGVF